MDWSIYVRDWGCRTVSDLLTQLSDYGNQLDAQTTPLEDLRPTRQPSSRLQVGWRGPLIAVGTAAAIVIAGLATVFLLREPSTDPVAPPVASTETTLAATSTILEATGPGAVFSWDGDNLSEWVTEAEMTAAVEDVANRHTNVALDGEAFFDHEAADVSGDEGEWIAGTWRVTFHNGDHDGRFDGPPTETDSRLPQGVTYEREQGFGWPQIIFSGPNSDETISIWLHPPGPSPWYSVNSHPENYEDMVFDLASKMLQEMGWVD